MKTKSKTSGFTLIEVMITVAIVAILASIALPSYRNYVIRGKIPEATNQLAAKRVRMEQFFQDSRTYVAAPAGNNDTTSSQYFDFSTLDAGGTDTRTTSTYTLFARGKASMAGFTYSIDQASVRSSTVNGVGGWSGNATCWVTRTGGQC